MLVISGQMEDLLIIDMSGREEQCRMSVVPVGSYVLATGCCHQAGKFYNGDTLVVSLKTVIEGILCKVQLMEALE